MKDLIWPLLKIYKLLRDKVIRGDNKLFPTESLGLGIIETSGLRVGEGKVTLSLNR